MATAIELLRAAEHIKGMADADRKCTTDVTRTGRAMMLLGAVVVMCEESARLQVIEAERSEIVHVATSDATAAACTRSLIPGHVVTTDEALVTCDVCRCILVGRAREASAPRSWPEGWPPFAVLRRAYERLEEVSVCPSTLYLERNGYPDGERIRRRWRESLEAVLGEVAR